MRISMSPRAHRARAGLVAAALLSAACHVWQPAGVGDLQGPTFEPGTRVRVLRADGARLTLTDVQVLGDSLTGAQVVARGHVAGRVAVPLAQVRALEARQLDADRSVALGIVVTGVAALAAVVLFAPMVLFGWGRE